MTSDRIWGECSFFDMCTEAKKGDAKGAKNGKLLIDLVRGGKRHARENATEKANTKENDRRDTK